jgi:RNA-directed DNA polymerase
LSATKPFTISKQLVMEAYKAVKANAGAAGVDRQSIEDFEKELKGNLYKIWNRMSSGSYFPPPIKAVEIPKKSGGTRILGVPTVADRVAQMVVKMTLEPYVEPIFLPDSYGYRPRKSALDAIEITRERCWQYDWTLEFDIKGMFDNISHKLLLRAVKRHTDCKWVILYIERWLKAPLQLSDGTLVERNRGISQGGVASPILCNLFMHYTFDLWMNRTFIQVPWCRYADDGLVHCKTEQEAQRIRAALAERLAECGLEIHPDKTRIIYCQDTNRQGQYPNTKFDFLGYTFRPRVAKNRKYNRLFVGFMPAVSSKALKTMRQTTRKWNLRNRADLGLNEIAQMFNPILRGWYQYYGRFCLSAMNPVWRHFNQTLISWAMKKYRKLRGHRTRAAHFMESIARRQPSLFVHWRPGMVGMFA